MNNLPECPGEMTLVVKPACRGNFGDGGVPFAELYTGLADAVAVDVLCRGQVEAFLKIPAQGTHGETRHRCQVGDVDRPHVVFTDVLDHLATPFVADSGMCGGPTFGLEGLAYITPHALSSQDAVPGKDF